MIEYVAWVSNIMLAVCGVPLALQAFNNKYTNISLGFIWLWFLGEAGQTAYAIHLGSYPLLLNCIVNLVCISTVWYYNEGSL